MDDAQLFAHGVKARPHGEQGMQQRLRFVEEDAVVADVVDDFQGLIDTLWLSQAPTKLLQPQNL